jgi:hypothetical protein
MPRKTSLNDRRYNHKPTVPKSARKLPAGKLQTPGRRRGTTPFGQPDSTKLHPECGNCRCNLTTVVLWIRLPANRRHDDTVFPVRKALGRSSTAGKRGQVRFGGRRPTKQANYNVLETVCSLATALLAISGPTINHLDRYMVHRIGRIASR